MRYFQEARENHVNKKVEKALKSKMKEKALKECDYYTAKYAECATGKFFFSYWKCSEQAKERKTCLHDHMNDKVLEEMKKEYAFQEDSKRPVGV